MESQQTLPPNFASENAALISFKNKFNEICKRKKISLESLEKAFKESPTDQDLQRAIKLLERINFLEKSL